MRAVVIVLENALALSPDDEPIEIDAGTVGTELEIAISDRGPGVPEGKRESIFEAFTQTDSSTTRAHEGLGIGLYLARRILRAHGGRIEVAARPGGGSRFVLAFPAFAEVQPSGW